MIPMMPAGGGEREVGIRGTTIIDCNRCGRPTVFVNPPPSDTLCKGCGPAPREPEERTERFCPVDGAPLAAEARSNLTIDRCAQCGGVWLDGGELDLLLGAASARAEQRSERLADLLMSVFGLPPNDPGGAK